MDKISELRNILKDSFAWNKARLDCLSRIIVGMITTRTVNLSEIANNLGTQANYYRLAGELCCEKRHCERSAAIQSAS